MWKSKKRKARDAKYIEDFKTTLINRQQGSGNSDLKTEAVKEEKKPIEQKVSKEPINKNSQKHKVPTGFEELAGEIESGPEKSPVSNSNQNLQEKPIEEDDEFDKAFEHYKESFYEKDLANEKPTAKSKEEITTPHTNIPNKNEYTSPAPPPVKKEEILKEKPKPKKEDEKQPMERIIQPVPRPRSHWETIHGKINALKVKNSLLSDTEIKHQYIRYNIPINENLPREYLNLTLARFKVLTVIDLKELLVEKNIYFTKSQSKVELFLLLLESEK